MGFSWLYFFARSFSVLSSVLFWGVVLVVLVRAILGALGVRAIAPKAVPISVGFVKKHLSNLLSERDVSVVTTAPSTGKKGLHVNIKIILFGLGIRFVFVALAYFFMHPEGFGGAIADAFENFSKWDSTHFLNLARYGYAWTENDNNILVVFFPLYPWLIRLFALAFGDYLSAAMFVSFASYLAGLCFLFHLVKDEFCKRTAWWAVVLISIFPTSLFFGAPHTESLFFLTTVMTLYFIRKHNWLMVGVAGALATGTRMVGVFLIPAAAVEFVMHYELFTLMKKGGWGQFWGLVFKKGAWILLMLVGIFVYLFINWYITGDALKFLYFQGSQHWHNGFLYFGETMYQQILAMPRISDVGIRYNSMLYVHLPNVLGFAFVLWTIVYACIKRHNASFIVYALGYTFASFSMIWLLSGGRYAAALVPSFVFLADFVSKKPLRRGIVVVAIFVLLLLPILRMYIQGGFVI